MGGGSLSLGRVSQLKMDFLMGGEFLFFVGVCPLIKGESTTSFQLFPNYPGCQMGMSFSHLDDLAYFHLI